MHPANIAIKIYDHYESIKEVKHYFGVLAIYALAKAAELSPERDATLERVRTILSRFPKEIDHPRYNFPSYAIGGIGRAYMLFAGHMTDEQTAALVREYADEMMNAARDDAGIMSNPHRASEQLIWIDVAMAVTPYLLFAGVHFDEPRYVDEAVFQTFAMYDALMDHSTGLVHQCKNFVGPGQLSTDHWSRGQGWGLIALTELVLHLPPDSPHRKEAEQRFVAHCEALLPHQNGQGMWRQEVCDPAAWIESSGTGLIAYGYGVGLRRGLLEKRTFRPAFDAAVNGLLEHCLNADFSTEHSCPGCLCPGEGDRKGTPAAYVEEKEPYRDEPHSFAPLMLALCEASENGVDDLPAPQ